MAWKAVRRDRRAVFRLWSVATTVVVLALSAGCSSPRSAATVAEPPAAARAGVASPAASVVADPRLPPAVRAYEAYLREQAAALPARTRPFTDAVRAGDVTRARTLYAASRAGWERIQWTAVLLPQRLGRRIDARADDFAGPAGPADPAWTGWHRLAPAGTGWHRLAPAGTGWSMLFGPRTARPARPRWPTGSTGTSRACAGPYRA